jgi:hypothetical protein
MRQDFFDFTPKFKLWVIGNHKPRLDNVDEAMRRRLLLIPFLVQIPPEERDPDLPRIRPGSSTNLRSGRGTRVDRNPSDCNPVERLVEEVSDTKHELIRTSTANGVSRLNPVCKATTRAEASS